MPNVALIPEHATRIPLIEGLVDGFPEESHKLVTDTGNSPLEDGAIITDHAVARAEQLDLVGMVSDLTAAGISRPEEAWEQLRRIHREVVALDVVTPFGMYAEMLITSVVARRVGNGMRFRMKLENIIRVGLQPRQIQESTSSETAFGRDTELPRGRVEPEIITSAVDIPTPPTAPEAAQAIADASEAITVSRSPAVSRSMISGFADFNSFAGLPGIPSTRGLIPSHGSAAERVDSLASRLLGTQRDTQRRIRQIRNLVNYRRALRRARSLPGVNSALDILNNFRRPRFF